MYSNFHESNQYSGGISFTSESQEREYVPDRLYEYSRGARDRFESWGVDQSYGESLIELGYLYSYAYPERKLAQMLTGGLSIFTDKNGVNQIRYHSSSSTDPTLPYGSCGELARRKLIKGVSEGLFDRLDTQYGKLIPLTVRAYSPTHFITGEQRHVWIGILPENLYYSNYLSQMVVDDPSFRTITTFDEARYSLDTSDGPPNINMELPEIATYYFDSPVGKIKFNVVDGYQLTANTPIVLGVTRDYRHSICFNFVRDADTGLLYPLATLQNADGHSVYFGIQTSPHTPRIDSSERHYLSELPPSSIDQIKEILNLAYDAIAANNLK